MKQLLSVIGVGTCVAALCAVSVFFLAEWNQDPEGVRSIDIPFRESGYHHFESQVIRSQPELDAFVNQVHWAERSWNHRDEFIDGICLAKVEFKKEVLVLLRHTEGSGSVEVGFRRPRVVAKPMTCDAVKKTPRLGTCDMAYYCVAFAVATEQVETVEVRVNGVRSVVLDVKAD